MKKLGSHHTEEGLVQSVYLADGDVIVTMTRSSGCVFFDLGVDHPEDAPQENCLLCRKGIRYE